VSAGTVSCTVAVPVAAVPSDCVGAFADQPLGSPVSVNANVSAASPVFMTGKETGFACSILTSVTVPGVGSTRMPGPRTSKYARTVAPLGPIARTATLDAVPSLHVRDIVRCVVEGSAGFQASSVAPSCWSSSAATWFGRISWYGLGGGMPGPQRLSSTRQMTRPESEAVAS
jgi:hypothetical protein